ncbi:hypothetical protein GV791_09420 [Nocardia cyriacigeorgica]|uniref:Uncharacterized protein n=1 Tax=Nocardia cyriacigeorgica TaxID=135487 RepID=A0A6P1CJS3_9NOCA|nr:hypothetical protein [Nocardia cyriacigeorgica]NEW32780.1 hypothetical protein [Nocardia cyriacigeorgica]
MVSSTTAGESGNQLANINAASGHTAFDLPGTSQLSSSADERNNPERTRLQSSRATWNVSNPVDHDMAEDFGLALVSNTNAALCARYIEEHGLINAEIDPFGTIVVPSGVVDAIYLPRRLGEAVIEEMDARGLFSPIVENTTSGLVTILTDGRPLDASAIPCPTPERPAGATAAAALRTNASLFRYQAIRTVSGSHIALPGPSGGPRRWRWHPRGRDREAFATIADLTITVGERMSLAT